MIASTLIFAAPRWHWLTAGAVVLLAALIWFSAKARRLQLSDFADASLLASLLGSHSAARRVVKNTILFLSLIFLGLALARPQWGDVKDEVQRKGEDVVFLIDTSKSMLAADVRPNRLERAKTAMREFIHRYAKGSVGLVAFAGDSFLLCPPTMDYDAFEEEVGELDTDAIPQQGTNIAAAIFSGKKAFDKSDRRKVLVLLTDGEDLDQLGIKAAEEVAKEGVTIFSIGLGTTGGALIQVPQLNGTLGPLLDERNQPVTSRLDEATLRTIAETTGGTYRRLDSVTGGMADVALALRDAEKKPGGVERRRGVDRYEWPLAVAICLLVVESLLTTRRRAKLLQ